MHQVNISIPSPMGTSDTWTATAEVDGETVIWTGLKTHTGRSRKPGEFDLSAYAADAIVASIVAVMRNSELDEPSAPAAPTEATPPKRTRTKRAPTKWDLAGKLERELAEIKTRIAEAEDKASALRRQRDDLIGNAPDEVREMVLGKSVSAPFPDNGVVE